MWFGDVWIWSAHTPCPSQAPRWKAEVDDAKIDFKWPGWHLTTRNTIFDNTIRGCTAVKALPPSKIAVRMCYPRSRAYYANQRVAAMHAVSLFSVRVLLAAARAMVRSVERRLDTNRCSGLDILSSSVRRSGKRSRATVSKFERGVFQIFPGVFGRVPPFMRRATLFGLPIYLRQQRPRGVAHEPP